MYNTCVCLFSYYHPLFSLHIVIHIGGTMTFTYIYNVFFEYNHARCFNIVMTICWHFLSEILYANSLGWNCVWKWFFSVKHLCFTLYDRNKIPTLSFVDCQDYSFLPYMVEIVEHDGLNMGGQWHRHYSHTLVDDISPIGSPIHMHNGQFSKTCWR